MKTKSISFANGNQLNVQLEPDNWSFEDLDEFLSEPRQGGKHEAYFIRGGDLIKQKEYTTGGENPVTYNDAYIRKDEFLETAEYLIIDGDYNSKTAELPEEKHSAEKPIVVHRALNALKINHSLYTTHSHKRTKVGKDGKNKYGKKGVNKWRVVIPCHLPSKSHLKPTIYKLIEELKQFGLDVTINSEMTSWTQPWFTPTRDNPDDGFFGHHSKLDGKNYSAVSPAEYKIPETLKAECESNTVRSMVDTVLNGSFGVHTAIRKMTYMLMQDGVHSGTILPLMQGLMEGNPDKDKRWQDRYNEIKKLIDGVAKENHISSEKLQSAIRELQGNELILEKMDLNVFPKQFKDYAISFSKSRRVDPIIYVAIMLSIICTAMGKRYKIYEAKDHTLFATVGFVLAMQSGDKKSSSLELLMPILRSMQHYRDKIWKREKLKARAMNTDTKDRLSKLQKDLLKCAPDSPSYEAKIEEIIEMEKRIIHMTDSAPVIHSGNGTDEALLKVALENKGELFSVSDESKKQINIVLGEYKNGGSSNETLLNLRTGGYPDSVRVHSGSQRPKKLCGSMLWLTQHKSAMRLVEDEELAGDGFISRLSFLAPHRMPQYLSKKYEQYDATNDVKEFSDIIMRLYSSSNKTIRLENKTKELHRKFHNKIEKMGDYGNPFFGKRELINKVVSDSVRIASALQVFCEPDGVDGNMNVIMLKPKYYKIGIYLIELFTSWKMQYLEKSSGNKIAKIAVSMLMQLQKLSNYKLGNHQLKSAVKKQVTADNNDKDDAVDILIHVGAIDFGWNEKRAETIALNEMSKQIIETFKSEQKKYE